MCRSVNLQHVHRRLLHASSAKETPLFPSLIFHLFSAASSFLLSLNTYVFRSSSLSRISVANVIFSSLSRRARVSRKTGWSSWRGIPRTFRIDPIVGARSWAAVTLVPGVLVQHDCPRRPLLQALMSLSLL